MHRSAPSSRSPPSLVLLMCAASTACTERPAAHLESEVEEDDALVAAVASTREAGRHADLGAVTIVTSFDAFSGQLPESIAVDRFGDIYVSMSVLGEIWKLDPSGSFKEVVATFPTDPGGLFGVSGLTFDARGDLYATNTSVGEDVHGVWRIKSSGEKERIAGTSDIPVPNDIAITATGTLYITDSATGAVWRSLAGAPAEMWVQDETLKGTGAYGVGVPIGANGIVVVGTEMPFADGERQESAGGIVLANAEKGQVVHVPILPDGRAGQPTVMIADPSLFGIDGITMDTRGAIYGAVNAGNKVVRISPDGTDLSDVVSGEPLDFPSGLAFGTTRDRLTLLVVNFSVIHFLSDPPMPEDANPAVIAVPVDTEGVDHR